ncbi:hypothetical protein AB672_05725 [Xylella taiwanensis]|nr:hypothetical protein AB672_05725 [Xylella taiwanensis]
MLSGGVVLLGTLLGVALTTIADNTNGEAAVEGVWRLPKKNGQVINAWSKPIWSLSEAAFVNKDAAAGDLINSCIAVETAGASARTVKVKLLPGAGRVQT